MSHSFFRIILYAFVLCGHSMVCAKDYTIEQLKKNAIRNDILLPHENNRDVFLRIMIMGGKLDLWEVQFKMYINLPTMKGESADIRLNKREGYFPESFSNISLGYDYTLYLHKDARIHIENKSSNIDIKIFDGIELKKTITISNEEIAQFAWKRYISSIRLNTDAQNYSNLKYIINYYGDSLTWAHAGQLIHLKNHMDAQTLLLLALWFDIDREKSWLNMINALFWYTQAANREQNYSDYLWYYMFYTNISSSYWKKYNKFMDMISL